jgi:hypothetical protein
LVVCYYVEALGRGFDCDNRYEEEAYMASGEGCQGRYG